MSDPNPNPNPYRSPDAVVADVGPDSELAGRGVRLGAAIIDGIIMMVILFPLMFMGGYMQASIQAAEAGQAVGLGTMLLWAVIGFAAFVVVQGYPLHASGQTWGKKILGVKIVDLEGRKPSLGKLLALRYLPPGLVGYIPVVGYILACVNVLLIFRADRRCGHDLIAGTRVVRAN